MNNNERNGNRGTNRNSDTKKGIFGKLSEIFPILVGKSTSSIKIGSGGHQTTKINTLGLENSTPVTTDKLEEEFQPGKTLFLMTGNPSGNANAVNIDNMMDWKLCLSYICTSQIFKAIEKRGERKSDSSELALEDSIISGVLSGTGFSFETVNGEVILKASPKALDAIKTSLPANLTKAREECESIYDHLITQSTLGSSTFYTNDDYIRLPDNFIQLRLFLLKLHSNCPISQAVQVRLRVFLRCLSLISQFKVS